MAVPVIRDSTNTSSLASGTITLTKPTTSNGDLLLLICSNDSVAVSPEWNDVADWTKFVNDGNGTSDVKLGCYWRITDGTEGSTQAVTCVTTIDDIVGTYISVSGVDTTTPINVTGTVTNDTNIINHTALAVTTDTTECLGFGICAVDGADGDPATVSGTGWTIWNNFSDTNGTTGQGVTLAISTKTVTAAESSIDAVFTPAAQDGATTIQFAVAPGAGGTTTTQIGDIQMVLTVSGNQGIVP